MYLKHCSLFNKPRHFIWRNLVNSHKSDLNKIYTHPFNQCLLNGTLKPSIFGEYLRDDFIYLNHFSKILARLATRTQLVSPDLAHQLNLLSTDIIGSERDMHKHYKIYIGDHNAMLKPGKSISDYVDYLYQTTDTAKIPIALSSILPCFWIYYQLGLIHQRQKVIQDNPYAEWIATYSGNDFTRATRTLVSTLEQLEDMSSPEMQLLIEQSFGTSVRFELDFFEEIWTRGTLDDYPATLKS